MSVFSQKLNQLGDTLALALAVSPADLAAEISAGLRHPAIFIGSGGSVVAAAYAAECLRSLGGSACVIQTPLEFVLGSGAVGDTDVWLFSAQGRNADILSAFAAAQSRGARRIHVVTTNADSPLSTIARASDASLHLAPVAAERDGFLATHTLVSAVALWLCASDCVAGLGQAGSARSEALREASARLLSRSHRDSVLERLRPMTDEHTLIVLSDPRLAAAAMLIETSAWEAALAPVQRTDFRNFAHGRYVWLDQRPQQSFVLGLIGDETAPLWRTVAGAMPAEVPRTELNYADCGRLQGALAVFEALAVVEALGRARSVDPAKPKRGPGGALMYRDEGLLELVTRLRASER